MNKQTLVLDFEKPILELEKKISEMRTLSENLDIDDAIESLVEKTEQLKLDIYQNLTRWQRVQIARHPERPITSDYIANIFDGFEELHGDRAFKDDPAIVGGFAQFKGKDVMVIGHQKGRDTKSNLYRNFGMPNPDGYRKARRLMEMAEKFNKPIITLLDTPGAYPGLEAEERGQAEAIAKNLLVMAGLRTPILSIVIGEGASGGAIGIGQGDKVLMLENAWYSVIAPESCSSILWRSWEYKEQAAEALKLTATDLIKHNVIDTIIKEPVGGAHKDHKQTYSFVSKAINKELNSLMKVEKDTLIANRRKKYRELGVWEEKIVSNMEPSN
ncbi:MAG: acetyl-CoA carboxylase carboxyltransferase subunit alpha [Candidatus Kapaibacteriales bacterium]